MTRNNDTSEFKELAALVRQSCINSGAEQAKLVARGFEGDFGYSHNDLLRAADRL